MFVYTLHLTPCTLHLAPYTLHLPTYCYVCSMVCICTHISSCELQPIIVIRSCTQSTSSKWLLLFGRYGLGNCVHIPGKVTCHSQNLECPIRSSEIMRLHNNHCTTLTEESLALVHLAAMNCLLICHYLDLALRHKCNRVQVPCTAATYDAHTRETNHMTMACDSDVTMPRKWMQFLRPPS